MANRRVSELGAVKAQFRQEMLAAQAMTEDEIAAAEAKLGKSLDPEPSEEAMMAAFAQGFAEGYGDGPFGMDGGYTINIPRMGRVIEDGMRQETHRREAMAFAEAMAKEKAEPSGYTIDQLMRKSRETLREMQAKPADKVSVDDPDCDRCGSRVDVRAGRCRECR